MSNGMMERIIEAAIVTILISVFVLVPIKLFVFVIRTFHPQDIVWSYDGKSYDISSVINDRQVRYQGIELSFEKPKGNDTTIAYNYYKQEMDVDDENWKLDKNDIYITKHDLNDNGNPEIFLKFNNDGFCGTKGCLYLILQKTPEGRFVKIAHGHVKENIKVLAPKTQAHKSFIVDNETAQIYMGGSYHEFPMYQFPNLDTKAAYSYAKQQLVWDNYLKNYHHNLGRTINKKTSKL